MRYLAADWSATHEDPPEREQGVNPHPPCWPTTPVVLLSVGPQRDQTIRLGNISSPPRSTIREGEIREGEPGGGALTGARERSIFRPTGAPSDGCAVRRVRSQGRRRLRGLAWI